MKFDFYQLFKANCNAFVFIFFIMFISVQSLLLFFSAKNGKNLLYKRDIFINVCLPLFYFIMLLVMACEFLRALFYFLILSCYGFTFCFFIDALYKQKNKKADNNYVKAEKFLDDVKADIEIGNIKVKEEKQNKNGEINFNHVKNVIEKVEKATLNGIEKKEVEQLKENILLSEKYGLTFELKDKINEGLSVLLKIMSKYKV